LSEGKGGIAGEIDVRKRGRREVGNRETLIREGVRAKGKKTLRTENDDAGRAVVCSQDARNPSSRKPGQKSESPKPTPPM